MRRFLKKPPMWVGLAQIAIIAWVAIAQFGMELNALINGEFQRGVAGVMENLNALAKAVDETNRESNNSGKKQGN